MAGRVISYVFRGDFGNLKTGLTGVSRDVDSSKRKLGELEAQAKKSNANVSSFGKGLAGSLGFGVGSGAGAVGLGAAAGIAAIVSTTAKFDSAMSAVKAATHETTGNMKELRQAALDAGKETVYSATESAGAIEELAKAGVSTKDILAGGLSGALNLAAAGAVDVADAASIAATAMTQFKLSGDAVPHIADLLAAGAGKAQGSVQDLGMALNQSGLVASQMGLSIEETTGTLAAFASAGLIGSDAGTSFKTMLMRLANPSREAADTMKTLGINAYDAQGNFVGIRSLAGQLQTAFRGQSQAQRDAAMSTIFGSDAIRAANVLYNDGAAGIEEWTNKVNDSGYAAETASTRLDNLSGDFEKLKGSIETALIGSGEDSQGALRGLTQTATEAVDVFNKLPDGLQNSLGGIGGIWSNVKNVFGDSKKSSEEASDASTDAATATEQYATSLDVAKAAAANSAQSIESLAKSMQDQRKAALSAFDATTQYGEALSAAQAAAKKGKRGIDENTKAGRENRSALSSLAAAWNNQSDAVRNNSNKFRAARRDFITTATAMGVPEAAARRLARRLLEMPNSKIIKVTADTAGAKAQLDAIIARSAQIKDKTVRLNYIVNNINAGNKRAAGIPKADGGYIAGPGSATSDSIPAYLSNGEYVVRAAAVAKYGIAMFDSLNAGHFANGGFASLTGPGVTGGRASGAYGIAGIYGVDVDKNDKLKKRLSLFEKALEKATNSLNDERSARDSLKGSISSGLTGDLFGSSSSGSAFSRTNAAGSVGDVNARLRQQITDARQFATLERQLRARGVRGAALEEVIASGDINRLRMFASANNAQLSQYQSLYNQRGTAVGTAANTGAGVMGLNAEIAGTNSRIDTLTKEVRELRKDENRNHHEAQKTRRDQPAATGHAISDAAANGHKKRR